MSWRVHLLRPDELPHVNSVHSLQVNNYGHGEEYPLHYCIDHAVDSRLFDLADSKRDLRVALDLAVKFPNLEDLAIRTAGHERCSINIEGDPLEEYENYWEGQRCDARHDFAKALFLHESEIPRSLARASLDFMAPLERTLNTSHDKALPNLVSPALQDSFSSSLRVFSSHLSQLQLRAMIDDSLSWTVDRKVRP